jgi:hypothetical protein
MRLHEERCRTFTCIFLVRQHYLLTSRRILY